MDPNNPIDMEAARRSIASDLVAAAATPSYWGPRGCNAARIRAIDEVTDRAVRLGICRPRTDFDPRFAPRSPSSRKPKQNI
jgi:hypothetical protein